MWKTEINKILHTKLFYLAIIAGLVSTLLGLFTYYDSVYYYKAVGNIENISAFQAWLDCLSLGSSVYRLTVPLIIVPFIDSYYVERHSGYQNFVLTRCGRIKYYTIKWCAGVLSAIAVVLSVLLITLIVCLILFPLNMPLENSTYINYIRDVELFTSKPCLYIGYLMLLNTFFAAIYYSLGFSCSCSVKNRYVLMFIPFILYTVQLIIWQVFSLPELSPLIFIAPYEVVGLSKFSLLIPALVLILLDTILLTTCYWIDKNSIV